MRCLPWIAKLFLALFFALVFAQASYGAKVAKVNAKRKMVMIDEGAKQGFTKGAKVCFFKDKQKIACGEVSKVKATKAVVTVKKDIKKIKKGFTVELDDLGQDLVAMCANDLLTLGAQPLFFLDYFATGALDSTQFKRLLQGIRQGLAACGAELAGGETAEMPGLYQGKHFDLAGFMVGVVDRSAVLGPAKVQEQDVLIAFAASGFHSNGFSLLRSWLAKNPRLAQDPTLIEHLLAPTKIYSPVLALAARYPTALHALAHITGGGIPGNLARVIPAHLTGAIGWTKLPTPPWMADFIISQGVPLEETWPILNLGVGMIAVVAQAESSSFIKTAQDLGLEPCTIGKVVHGQKAGKVVLCRSH